MQERMRELLGKRLSETGTPGMSLTVIDQGTVSWSEAYGLADAGQRVTLTRDHLMYACSLSKFLTAMVALAAADHYGMNLDADINHYLRTWTLPTSDHVRGSAVTMRNLLCHQAGLVDADDGFGVLMSGSPLPRLGDILEGRTHSNPKPARVERPPYAAFSYSDAGYCIVEQALEDTSAKSFRQLATDLVLTPLGLRRSFLEQPIALQHATLAASGHNPDGQVLDGRVPVYPYLAAAGLWCSPSDFAHLLLELSQALDGHGRVLSRPMASDLIATPGQPLIGLGNFQHDVPDDQMIFHLGWGVGFQCQFVFQPHRGSGAVVMINKNPGVHQSRSVVGETVRALAEGYDWPLDQ